jgi:hypothetical protein
VGEPYGFTVDDVYGGDYKTPGAPVSLAAIAFGVKGTLIVILLVY